MRFRWSKNDDGEGTTHIQISILSDTDHPDTVEIIRILNESVGDLEVVDGQIIIGEEEKEPYYASTALKATGPNGKIISDRAEVLDINIQFCLEDYWIGGIGVDAEYLNDRALDDEEREAYCTRYPYGKVPGYPGLTVLKGVTVGSYTI